MILGIFWDAFGMILDIIGDDFGVSLGIVLEMILE